MRVISLDDGGGECKTSHGHTTHVQLGDGADGVVVEELEHGGDVVMPLARIDLLQEGHGLGHLPMQLAA
jgi:hypothetical protein